MADQSAGSAAGGDTTTSNPLEDLINRIRQTLGELTPEPLLTRLTPVIDDFLSQFQLVPVRDFQAHLQTLAELEATVNQLEERIRSLEQADEPSDHS